MAQKRHRRPRTNKTTPVDSTGAPIGDRVSISEHDGLLIAREPELFGPGREAFCRRLANAAVHQADVRSVRVCLASATCRLEFAAGQVSAADMANRFAASVHAAIPNGEGSPQAGDPGGWTAMTLFRNGEAVSTWETTREGEGELRLRNPILHRDLGLARRVAQDLTGAAGIESARATFWTRDLEIQFDPATTSSIPVVSAAEDAFQHVLRPALDQATAEEHGTPPVATGLRRVWYLVMAGGCFGLTMIGFIVPGVPTVPFLLATSYYLVRSSPRLHRILLHSRFFGPILSDLETWGGLRRINKIKLISLTLTVGIVSLMLIGPPLILVLVAGAVASASIYAITQLPSLPSPARKVPGPIAH